MLARRHVQRPEKGDQNDHRNGRPNQSFHRLACCTLSLYAQHLFVRDISSGLSGSRGTGGKSQEW